MAASYDTPTCQTIFRKKKRRGWTTLDNALLDDKRLSFKAVGLLCFLLSKPDDWRFNYRHITTTHSDGESAVRSGMKELEQFGYLTRVRQRQGDGTLAWVITVHEEPVATDDPPCGGFPRMDNPGVEDRHLLSTEGVSTEEPTPLTLLSEERVPTKKQSLEAEFDEWWEDVWRKERKQSAKKHYIRIRSKGMAERDWMFAQRDAYKKLMIARQRPTDKQRIPANWLDDGDWEDEITPDAPPQQNPDYYTGPEMRIG